MNQVEKYKKNKMKKQIKSTTGVKKEKRTVSGLNKSRRRRIYQKKAPTDKDVTDVATKTTLLDLDVDRDAAKFFTSNATLEQHYEAQVKNKNKYLATLMAFDEYSIEILPNARVHLLAAAFSRRDKTMVDFFLNHNKQFGFVDLLKAVTLLDSGREKRAIEKKLARVSKTGTVMKTLKLKKFNMRIKNLEKMIPKQGSCSGALARYIRSWVRKLTASELEFYALQLPTEPWRKLADIVHLNPSKDFPNAPWFLPFCFGTEPDKGSKLDLCRNMTGGNVNELIQQFDLPYSILKKFKGNLNEASKLKIAENQASLDTILWYYEDLACKGVDDVIRARLERGDRLELGYGKLMERLMMFKERDTRVSSDERHSLFSLIIPIAESRLKSFKSTLPEPVAVLGDASGSMEVAIKTSTIISSLLTAICDAKLSFFNSNSFEPSLNPKNVSQVLELAHRTRAENCTSPAAALVPYCEKQEVIKTFIIVTDEEENTNAVHKEKSWRFFELFKEYRQKVYPATLIFVSFLSTQHAVGQMYRQFLNDKVEDVMQFKFSRERPDLTKLDSILGSICSRSSQSFSGYVEKIESELKVKSLVETFGNLKTNNNEVVIDENAPIKIQMI